MAIFAGPTLRLACREIASQQMATNGVISSSVIG